MNGRRMQTNSVDRWTRCDAGSSAAVEMHWLLDYSVLHRGFLIAQEDGGFEGVVCELMCNPFSREGVLARRRIDADDLLEACAGFESFCAAEGYLIAR